MPNNSIYRSFLKGKGSMRSPPVYLVFQRSILLLWDYFGCAVPEAVLHDITGHDSPCKAVVLGQAVSKVNSGRVNVYLVVDRYTKLARCTAWIGGEVEHGAALIFNGG